MNRIYIWILGYLLLLTTHVDAQQIGYVDSLAASMGKDFISGKENLEGVELHYVKGGHGPVIILIHGFPQDWYEYRPILPLLARQYTVIAIDLRGIGDSRSTKTSYDAVSLAEDVHQLCERLQLSKPYLVGHDIGGMVAYAFLRKYTSQTRGIMILDVPLPGMSPWEEIVVGQQFWHIGFHKVPALAEKLIEGRQKDYFRYMLDPKYFTDFDMSHYTNAYSRSGQLQAGLGLYRAFDKNAEFFAGADSKISPPVVWAAGDRSFFGKIGEAMVMSLRSHGCLNVFSEIIANSGHYVINEQPVKVAALIEKYASPQ